MKITRSGEWRRALTVGWLPLVFALVCNAAATEYKLAPGDVVEVTIAGLPEWRNRVAVQLDGTISLPTLGVIEIAGLTASEMRNRIAAVLPTRLFRQWTPEGREYTVLVLPTDIAATVVEYRPIYVDGDVLTPGQYAFRPLMSVRQAVALSGATARCGRVPQDSVPTERWTCAKPTIFKRWNMREKPCTCCVCRPN